MSPSRGFNCLLRLRLRRSQSIARHYSLSISPTEPKIPYDAFQKSVTNPKHKSQAYVSRIRDPYVNLSIEHYLLQNTPADSTILFLYINSPCVVIGRNQNPWSEVNLELLKKSPLGIQLVRRRSGGGAVFHDEGNVNYSVICPTADFDRDRHAEMVVRALSKGRNGVKGARVNKRHDIVIDTQDDQTGETRPLKVSGSAYKLTRLRSLHHGTCLLSSYALDEIGAFLRSPAKPYITARGVESVRSPITNANRQNDTFIQSVTTEFIKMYGIDSHRDVDEDDASAPDIEKGVMELTSLDWIYDQTPQFTFSGKPVPEIGIDFTVRHGAITDAKIEFEGLTEEDNKPRSRALIGRKLLEVDWNKALRRPTSMNEYFPSRIEYLTPVPAPVRRVIAND